MSIAPLLPLWLIVLLIAAGPVVVFWVYRRPSVPAVCRLLAWLILAAYLLNPVRIEPVTSERQAAVAVVVDRSASMAAADSEGRSRFATAMDASVTLRTGLADRYRIDPYALDTALRPGDPVQGAEATDFGPLAELADRDDLAAVVLISDGVDRGERPPDESLAGAGIPVFTVPVGDVAPATNLALQLTAASPSAFPGQELSLRVTVQAEGAAVGRSTEVVISRADGTELLRQTVTPEPTAELAVTDELGEDLGEAVYIGQAAELENEVSSADNRDVTVVRVVDRPLRLAVIEGQPFWDTSFAVRSWRRDRQLDVQTVYHLGKRRYRSGGSLTIDELLQPATLQDVDLVVIGNHSEEILDEAQQRALVAFADSGGGLLFLGSRGAIPGPLAAADPVLRRDLAGRPVTPVLTRAGRLAALLPADIELEPVTASPVVGLRPRSTILLGDTELPLVVERRYGGGRVAAVNAEGIWRWSLGLGADSDAAARFWRQLAKALVRRQAPDIGIDRPRYRVGQQALLAPLPPDTALIARDPAGTERQLPVDSGSAVLTLDQPGLWTVQAGERQRSIPVRADDRELVDRARRDDRLIRLARATGGDFIRPNEVAGLADRLARRSDLRAAEPVRHPLVLWPWWLVAWVACLGTEWWWRRRRWGAL